MFERITRRDFVRHASAVTLGAGFTGGATAQVHASERQLPESIREYRRGGMVYRRLGRTDLFVSQLSFGSHIDPSYRVPGKLGSTLNEEGQRRRNRLIARALDLGVNTVDVYNNAGQWAPMATLVKGRREKVQVSLCRQLPGLLGGIIDDGARLFGGYIDLYRIYLGDGTPDAKTLEDWDVLRRAKQAGKVRAIGISTHSARMMTACLEELEGLDYIMFPYNFIHAKADYVEFLPAAIKKGVGLMAIKPLAAGSIVKLDPRAKAGSKPENDRVMLYQKRDTPILPEVVARLTDSLGRMPEESLCQAALRFVYSRPFMTCALPGMFQEHELDDNYTALERQQELSRTETEALEAARALAHASHGRWLPQHYRWLDERWRA
jgi:aryl-alcohol dehydrogenase-like predicted oxidoreductase